MGAAKQLRSILRPAVMMMDEQRADRFWRSERVELPVTWKSHFHGQGTDRNLFGCERDRESELARPRVTRTGQLRACIEDRTEVGGSRIPQPRDVLSREDEQPSVEVSADRLLEVECGQVACGRQGRTEVFEDLGPASER
jgi:hypothetical protein